MRVRSLFSAALLAAVGWVGASPAAAYEFLTGKADSSTPVIDTSVKEVSFIDRVLKRDSADEYDVIPVSCCCEPSGGFIAGAEWTYMKPHMDHGISRLHSAVFDFTGFNFTADIVIDDISWAYESAPRLWGGYENANGFGGRIVWWYFDHTTGAEPLIHIQQPIDFLSVGKQSVKAYTLDMEFTQRTYFRNWSLLGSAGLRYAEITTDERIAFYSPLIVTESSFSSKMSGIGPTVGLQASRPVFGNFSLFTQARGSLIYGNGRERTNLDANFFGFVNDEINITTSRDDLMSIVELRIGGEYLRTLANGNTLFARGTFETQYWAGAVKDNYGFNYGTDDIGFLGFTLGAGLGY